MGLPDTLHFEFAPELIRQFGRNPVVDQTLQSDEREIPD
jgi:hypothetical protein